MFLRFFRISYENLLFLQAMQSPLKDNNSRFGVNSLVTLYSRVPSAACQKSVDGTLGSQPNDDYVGSASGAGLASFLGTF